MQSIKNYVIGAIAAMAVLGFIGKCLYNWGYRDCNEEWIAASNEAKDKAQVESKNEYERLQKELAETYERGVLAGYDQRLRELEQMRASGGVETRCHDRDAVLELAIDQEKALGEAVEFLRAERQR